MVLGPRWRRFRCGPQGLCKARCRETRFFLEAFAVQDGDVIQSLIHRNRLRMLDDNGRSFVSAAVSSPQRHTHSGTRASTTASWLRTEELLHRHIPRHAAMDCRSHLVCASIFLSAAKRLQQGIQSPLPSNCTKRDRGQTPPEALSPRQEAKTVEFEAKVEARSEAQDHSWN